MPKPMTENEALSAIQAAASMAIMHIDRAAVRLRTLRVKADTAWVARTPEERKEAVGLVHDYYVDSLRAVEGAQRALMQAAVLRAATDLASGQCAPEEKP